MIKRFLIVLFFGINFFIALDARYRAYSLPANEKKGSYTEDYHKMFPAGIHFEVGELVFFRQNNGTYAYGAIRKQINDTTYSILSINDNQIYYLDKASLRALAPLWKTIYQPHVDQKMFDTSLRDVLESFPEHEKAYLESITSDIKTKLVVVGDLHGCRKSLAYMFEKWQQMGILRDNLEVNPGYKIIFLGDYADRVPRGIEVYYMLFELKNCNNDDVFLCRGNHEDSEMAQLHGFFAEWTNKFGDSTEASKTWEVMETFFGRLPYGLFFSNKIGDVFCPLFFSHGGVEPISHLLKVIYTKHYQKSKNRIAIEMDGIACDSTNFCWLDFFANDQDSHDLKRVSARGAEIESWSHAAFEQYAKTEEDLTGSLPFKYKFWGLIRGHQHDEVCTTGRLRITKKNNSSWKQFEEGRIYPINQYDVITLVSVPDAFSDFEGYNADTFAIVSFDDEDGWLYTPYIHQR